MRAFKRHSQRGFTLVELMIVVAIIGVLAALAIFGVRRYLATAKTSEAKNSVGAIVRNGVAAFERETTPAEMLPAGGSGSAAVHAFCASAGNVVPSAGIPSGVKYQPNTATAKDYQTGDATGGWKCLRFEMTEAHYYQYDYQAGAAQTQKTGTKGDDSGFEAVARGDLNGNGASSTFARAAINRAGSAIVGTELFIAEELE